MGKSATKMNTQKSKALTLSHIKFNKTRRSTKQADVGVLENMIGRIWIDKFGFSIIDDFTKLNTQLIGQPTNMPNEIHDAPCIFMKK